MYMSVFVLNSNMNSFFVCAIVEREQMCNFYKERGLDIPKPGKIVSVNRLGGNDSCDCAYVDVCVM